MNERPSVRERLAKGERCYGTMVFDLFTPATTAVLADCGYDFAILDTEHSGVGIETIKQQIAYARGLPIEVWVRVPEKTYAAVATVLDAGAQGVMVPMLETAEEAQALVSWARYQPEGKRGLAFGVGHDAYRGRDPQAAMAAANARNCVLGLIETREGHRELRRHPGHARLRPGLARPLRPHGRPGLRRAVGAPRLPRRRRPPGRGRQEAQEGPGQPRPEPRVRRQDGRPRLHGPRLRQRRRRPARGLHGRAGGAQGALTAGPTAPSRYARARPGRWRRGTAAGPPRSKKGRRPPPAAPRRPAGPGR